jgi:hypothetical protein
LSELPERPEPDVLPELVVPLVWPTEEPCVELDVAPVLDEVWPAVTELFTLWLPLPIFTPGLTFAPTFRSELLMLAFASTPTFGFTLSVGLTERPLLELEVDGVEDEVVPLPVEAEPLSEPFEVVAEPLMPPFEVDAEPLRPPVDDEVEPFMPAEPVLPLVVPVAPPLVVAPVVEPVVPLLLVLVVALEPLSSRQSWCTGLAECSFAAPVLLSASLPALGFL